MIKEIIAVIISFVFLLPYAMAWEGALKANGNHIIVFGMNKYGEKAIDEMDVLLAPEKPNQKELEFYFVEEGIKLHRNIKGFTSSAVFEVGLDNADSEVEIELVDEEIPKRFDVWIDDLNLRAVKSFRINKGFKLRLEQKEGNEIMIYSSDINQEPKPKEKSIILLMIKILVIGFVFVSALLFYLMWFKKVKMKKRKIVF